jgi:peptidylprolyl isomerase
MEVGKPAISEISQEKAFGSRDPEKIKRVPLKQLLAKEITPTIGLRIEYNGKMATIRAVGAGRVLLDFNPPLAGKTLVYDATVRKKLETTEEQVASLIHRRIPVVDHTKVGFTVKEKTISIDMPEEAFYLEGIQVAKRGIMVDVQKFFPRITAVKFSETFTIVPKEEEKKPEKEAEAKTK